MCLCGDVRSISDKKNLLEVCQLLEPGDQNAPSLDVCDLHYTLPVDELILAVEKELRDLWQCFF